MLLKPGTNEVSAHSYVRCDESKCFGDLVEFVTVSELVVPEVYQVGETALVTKSLACLTFGEALNSEDSEWWRNAIQEELDNLDYMDTFEFIERPKDKKVIRLKWMSRIKNDETFKARLVVLSYQDTTTYSDD